MKCKQCGKVFPHRTGSFCGACLPRRKGEYVFDIEHTGDFDAGLRPYNDRVTVTVGSGDPGGEPGEFSDYISTCLADWFNGAYVITDPKE